MNCERSILPGKISRSIDTVSFYGSSSNRLFEDASTTILPVEQCPRFTRLFGPSILWKVFRKQYEVIEFVSKCNCDLFPFTYQINDGTRLFLAAHPITFWYIDEQRDPEQRHSYEIIQEGKACKLYFDLEFEIPANPNHDGYEMVNIFIDLVCIALRNKYKISCSATDILNLDSSSATKFSCHLIFPNVYFLDNLHAGHFVKQLCYEIKSVAHGSPDLCLLQDVHSLEQMRTLLIADSKGNQKLFCDEGVYTKNRHFRLYKSSKFGKNIALRVSKCNLFEVTGTDQPSREENLFLCSLITHCDRSRMKLVYECDASVISEKNRQIFKNTVHVTASPIAEIDTCINRVVYPGKIYRSRFLPEKRIIIYDIVGNRYCGNIGRPHKSNNVKYIVDVNSLTYYQKCHDPDCAEFRSPKMKLPVDESVFINNNIDDELVLAAADQCELPSPFYKSWQTHREGETFSSSEDEDLIEAAERCELMNRSRGRSLILQDADDSVLSEDHESLESTDRSASGYQDILSDNTDHDSMVRVSDDCETSLTSRKRKMIENTPEEERTCGNRSNDKTKRKLIHSAIFLEMDEDLIVTATEMCEKFLKMDNH